MSQGFLEWGGVGSIYTENQGPVRSMLNLSSRLAQLGLHGHLLPSWAFLILTLAM